MKKQEQTLDQAMAAIETAARQDRFKASAAKKISQARTDTVMGTLTGRDSKAAFFTSVIMRLPMVPTTEIDTAATDGKRMLYNPEFIDGLTRHEVLGVIGHEVLHITNAHHARMGDRNPELWNIACDLAINPILINATFKLPKACLMPGMGDYHDLQPGLSADAYYAALRKNPPPKSRLGGGDPGGCGGVRKPGAGTAGECMQAEAEAKQVVAAAQQAARMSGMGDMPQGICEMVDELLEPKVDYKHVLRDFVSSSARNDYSWARPNRRYVHMGLYLPGMHSDELGDVVIAVDQSRSISDEQVQQCASEVQGVLEAYDCTVTILYHDSKVSPKIVTWQSSDGPLKLERVCSGGTSHVPVFEKVDELGLTPKCMLCLTDMETRFPKVGPDYPVLWMQIGGDAKSAPFGQLINVE